MSRIFLSHSSKDELAAVALKRWLVDQNAPMNGRATGFNAGLFRGLSGVGYTCLRAIDDTLPNVLTWE